MLMTDYTENGIFISAGVSIDFAEKCTVLLKVTSEL